MALIKTVSTSLCFMYIVVILMFYIYLLKKKTVFRLLSSQNGAAYIHTYIHALFQI